jgi:hypothetical protein
MITLFQLIDATITPGHHNRFANLYERLGTKDMTLVLILMAVNTGYDTREAIDELRKNKSNKQKILECVNLGYLQWVHSVSPHDKRARMKIYKLTPKAQPLVRMWEPILNNLLEKTNSAAASKHASQH